MRGDRIEAVGPRAQLTVPNDAATIDLAGATLMPGLIEGHSHLLLHPYNETPWDDQVLHEALALRVARAVNHARATLMAGWTTVRDLGTEGAGYADVGLKQAINQGIIPGPRMVVVTRAIVATGSYAPKGFTPEYIGEIPQGAEEAGSAEDLSRIIRDEIKHGADWIKIYADYRWGPNGETMPTFTAEELKLAVEVAKSSGRAVTVHSSTAGHAPRDRGRCRIHRAWRQRDAGDFSDDGAEGHLSVPDGRRGRCDSVIPRLAPRRRSGPAEHS